ncbi:MAG: glycosyltransferase family 9 protein [Noviherbaspirillum sp.]|nr:glycosyltransferase family 9 protein [Noviherbaspirillum sp.]
MSPSLVPADLLRKSDKILFIAHLALGDFTYLQSCLRAFSEAFPHIAIHLWVDELRRTSRKSEWEALRKYSLYDWLAECPFIAKVYNRTYSPALYRESIREARRQKYPIVVSFGLLRRQRYARLARRISPDGFVAGQVKRVRFLDIPTYLAYRKLDARIPSYSVSAQDPQHISDIYAGWFKLLFGMEVAPAARFPFVDIPESWKRHAEDRFAAWGFTKSDRVVFLNSFSKGAQRNWPLQRIIELIRAMRAHEAWRDTAFLVNVVPEELDQARKLFAGCALPRVHLFSAVDNFFELPAILRLCNLVISVETAIMHLANAVHVPVIALMRQRNPEWTPIDRENSIIISVPGAEDWVDKITVDDVMKVLGEVDEQRLAAAR